MCEWEGLCGGEAAEEVQEQLVAGVIREIRGICSGLRYNTTALPHSVEDYDAGNVLRHYQSWSLLSASASGGSGGTMAH